MGLTIIDRLSVFLLSGGAVVGDMDGVGVDVANGELLGDALLVDGALVVDGGPPAVNDGTLVGDGGPPVVENCTPVGPLVLNGGKLVEHEVKFMLVATLSSG